MKKGTLNFPKDQNKLNLLKTLLEDMKEKGSDTKCVFKTTSTPSKEIIQKIEDMFQKEVIIEILDKQTYLGGGEIICNGKVYSNLITKEINKIKAHLLNNTGKA